MDVETGYGGSALITKKGGTDRYAVAFCLSVLTELGYADLILLTDSENSIMDLARTVAGQVNGTAQARATPAGSSASDGSVESFHQSAQGVARTPDR